MKFKKGFTLLELLIVVGITTILAGVGVSSYINQQRAKLLDTAAQEIVGYLRYAQQKSIAQEDGNQWGVHFENPASGGDFYTLYAGTSYSSPEETRYIPGGLEFQLPLSGNTVDISFSKLTGQNYTDTEQEVIINLIGSQIAQVIRVMPNGVMTSGGGEKGYWKFDEGVGNSVADETIYKNTGTLYNSPTWKVSSNCISGTCLEFDGIDDYISIESSFGILQNYTVSFWAKHNIANKMPIASMVDTSFYWYGDNSWRYVHGGVGGEFYYPKSVSIPYGTWGYFSVTYDGTNLRIYRNGVLEGSKASTGAANFSNGFFLGQWASSVSYRFNGLIDEVRIYNRALSASEILQHYKARE